MIKECNVLFYNKFLNILVFEYEGKKIQITAEIDNTQKTVFVRYKNNKYEVVTKNDYHREFKNKDNSIKVTKKSDISKT